MNDYPKRYLFSFDHIIDLIKQSLYTNISIVAECLNFGEVLDYELEVAIVGEKWRWCYGDDKLERLLVDLCPQVDRRRMLINEIREAVSVRLHTCLCGEPKETHQYEYQRIGDLGSYLIIDKGDYRIAEYYRMVRAQNEDGLEHGYIPDPTEHSGGHRAHVIRVPAPGL